ncbi:MAG: cytochrome C, partial [Gemmatimonadota bacterium]
MILRAAGLVITLVALLPVGCTLEVREPAAATVVAAAHPDTLPLRIPTDATIPEGAHGASIRRGRAILMATGDSLPGFVGNDLRCTSCHLDAG